jgi:hypothetical protein
MNENSLEQYSNEELYEELQQRICDGCNLDISLLLDYFDTKDLEDELQSRWDYEQEDNTPNFEMLFKGLYYDICDLKDTGTQLPLDVLNKYFKEGLNKSV